MKQRDELIYPELKHIGVLDGIRAISVFLVSIFHFWQQSWLQGYIDPHLLGFLGYHELSIDWLLRYGFVFVDMMILLSGFLLYLPVARNRSPFFDIKQYFRKRAARILPSYYFSIVIMLIFFVRPSQYQDIGYFFKDLFTHLSFTQTFWSDTMLSTKYLTVSWTLAIELQFYLIFPMAAKLFRKHPVLSFSGMLIITAAYIYFVPASHPESIGMSINQLPAYLAVYALGMMGAEISVKLSRTLKKRWNVYLIAGLIFVLGLALARFIIKYFIGSGNGHSDMQLRQVVYRFPLSLVFLVIILSLMFSAPFLRFIFSCKLMRFGSVISYNYYLWHQFIAVKFREWRIPYYPDNPGGDTVWPQGASTEPWHTKWQISFSVIIFFASVITALLITVFIERPFSRLILGKKPYFNLHKRKKDAESH